MSLSRIVWRLGAGIQSRFDFLRLADLAFRHSPDTDQCIKQQSSVWRGIRPDTESIEPVPVPMGYADAPWPTDPWTRETAAQVLTTVRSAYTNQREQFEERRRLQAGEVTQRSGKKAAQKKALEDTTTRELFQRVEDAYQQLEWHYKRFLRPGQGGAQQQQQQAQPAAAKKTASSLPGNFPQSYEDYLRGKKNSGAVRTYRLLKAKRQAREGVHPLDRLPPPKQLKAPEKAEEPVQDEIKEDEAKKAKKAKTSSKKK